MGQNNALSLVCWNVNTVSHQRVKKYVLLSYLQYVAEVFFPLQVVAHSKPKNIDIVKALFVHFVCCAFQSRVICTS